MPVAGGGAWRWVRAGMAATALLATLPGAAAAQPLPEAPPGHQSITNEGVVRAAGAVDSVYLDGLLTERVVGVGDFASYLMARLGIVPIPPDLGFRVVGDTAWLRLTGRVSDLPPEARAALGPMVAFLAPSTTLDAWVILRRETPRAVRFRLDRAAVGGVRVPEDVVAVVMREVGRQYPALSETGRDLFVQVPEGAGMDLVVEGVRLRAPAPPPELGSH